MLPEANDSESQLSKYLAWKDKDEASPKSDNKDELTKDGIPKPKPNEETPKSDDNNEYEYSDNDNEDDRNW